MTSKKDIQLLPPIIFSGKTSKERKHLTALKEQGLLRSIGPKVYTSVPEREVASLLRSSWGMIVANLFPNALVSHVSALTYTPNKDGEIFLTTTSNRNIRFPGLTLRLMRGAGVDIDNPIFMGIRASSFERAILENLASAKGSVSGRVMAQELIEKKLADILPGEFKTKNNQAGSTIFVLSDYLMGTLQKGFELYASLPPGLARAIFMMFFISDVHPFNNGNGRISRIMMNAELYSQNLSTIIIPNVYREDYLLSLRALSTRHDPDPFTRMLVAAHEFSGLDFSNYVVIKEILEKKNWFQEPSDAKLIYGK